MPKPPKPPPDAEARRKAQVQAYAKYSGMAFQMAGIILVFTLLGREGDRYFQFESPYLAVGGAVLGTFGALYVTLKDIIAPKR